MLRLPDITLSATALHQLDRWQAEVDAHSGYAARVDAAKRAFEQHNSARNRTFAEVRRTLAEMCSGEQRCGYCEDSVADEIDHIWPKHLYPEQVFAWRNYLYACGRCNGPKSEQFAVFTPRARKPVDVGRPRGVSPIRPPLKGPPALIDPRSEDPMEFLVLELRDTFYFEPSAKRGTRNYERADYTLRVLQLNKREYLRKARETAFIGYQDMLTRYVSLRERRAPTTQLELRRKAVQRSPHRTVWKEMQRQHSMHPALRTLFRKAPEAIHW
ncbi:hypothetical protein [Archangium violaceum]|uniref:HNH nuclease domain-containing protein n=1 Tax=Archangium violaceum Cb vi76 TaxID=1406225 RepID=A0A084SUT8_9BACT|nr:hypothetical protein [Archangium violaceum]KFA92223.1 hypothetical protein Q664_16735 [Archangium violaceum Cb vi76]